MIRTCYKAAVLRRRPGKTRPACEDSEDVCPPAGTRRAARAKIPQKKTSLSVEHRCVTIGVSEGVVRAAGMRFVNHWDGLGPRIEATHLIPTKPPGPKARLVKNKASLQNGW